VWSELARLLVAHRAAEALRVMADAGVATRLWPGSGRVDRAVGIDMSREMLAVARAKLDAGRLHNCQVRLGNLFQLPFTRDSFDLAVMHQVMHFLDSPQLALQEAARVLRPGGRMILVDFAAHDVESLRGEQAHRWLGFEEDEVRAWLKAAGFTLAHRRELTGDPLTVCIWAADL